MQVTIPDTVTEIGDSAFEGCDSHPSIQFPPNLERIGDMAFYNCTSVEADYLPPTVTHIGGMAFYDCTLSRLLLRKNVKYTPAQSGWTGNKHLETRTNISIDTAHCCPKRCISIFHNKQLEALLKPSLS